MLRYKNIIRASVCCTTLTGILVSGQAGAQSTIESEAASNSNVIIVTARKKSESIQDTPLAVTAFDSEAIENSGFENIVDVAQATPGVNIESFNSSPGRLDTQPRFRGIIFDSSSEPLSRTGLTLIDGIVVTGGVQGIGVGELERVEIIKGPQSALFGRNSFSGAINYITKEPSSEFGVEGSLLAATRDEYRASISVEGPIIGEVLTARINGSYSSNGGHYVNNNVPGQELGEEETWAISGAIKFEPSDNVKIKIRARYYEDDDGPAAIVATAGVLQHNFGGFPVVGGVTDTTAPFSGIPTSAELSAGTRTETAFRGRALVPTRDNIGLNTDLATFNTLAGNTDQTIFLEGLGITLDELGGFGLRREAFRIGGSAEIDISDNLKLDILGGYSDEAVLGLFDFDGTADAAFYLATAFGIEDYSIEGRLSGSLWDDRLEWSVGANYYQADVVVDGGFGFGAGSVFPGFLTSPAENGAETIGIFGTLDFAITDQLSIALEGRYQEDEISSPGSNSTTPGVAPISPGTFKKFLPRVVVSFEPNPDTLFYANWGIGNLPGGFNSNLAELDATEFANVVAQAPGAGVTFDEERLVNYEIGWKQTTLDGSLIFNAAAFYMERKDEVFTNVLTIPDTDPTSPGVQTVTFTDNGASTRIYGVELDWALTPSENFQMQGSFAYINSEIQSFPATSDAGDFNDIFGDDASVTGQEAPRFPPITVTVGATFSQPIGLGPFEKAYIRGDGFFTSGYYASNANLTNIGDRMDVNLRVGIQGENLRLEAFVTNLFGEDAPVGINNIADTSFATSFFDFSREGAQIALHPRRQLGLRSTFSF